VFNICMEISLSADRTCALMKAHPDDPWSYTCGAAQRNASKLCEEAEQRYASSLSAAVANYVRCLAMGCRKAAPCPRPDPNDDDIACTDDGTCSASTGRPIERHAAETESHNDFINSY
jgi:hypothetical protein